MISFYISAEFLPADMFEPILAGLVRYVSVRWELSPTPLFKQFGRTAIFCWFYD